MRDVIHDGRGMEAGYDVRGLVKIGGDDLDYVIVELKMIYCGNA
jgi:hypothetical protein